MAGNFSASVDILEPTDSKTLRWLASMTRVCMAWLYARGVRERTA
jgi:hypothetical protein